MEDKQPQVVPSTAANSLVSHMEVSQGPQPLKKSVSLFNIGEPRFIPETISLRLNAPTKAIKKLKFPVFREDLIFSTKLRSTTKAFKKSISQALDFDVDSSDGVVEDSIFFNMRNTLRSVLAFKKFKAEKIPKKKAYLNKMVAKYELDRDSEELESCED